MIKSLIICSFLIFGLKYNLYLRLWENIFFICSTPEKFTVDLVRILKYLFYNLTY